MPSTEIEFHPKKGTEYTQGWPDELLGNDFINVSLSTVDGDCAIYRDGFGDEYEAEDVSQGSWWFDVRED